MLTEFRLLCLRTSRLNPFAIRTRFAPSVRKSAKFVNKNQATQNAELAVIFMSSPGDSAEQKQSSELFLREVTGIFNSEEGDGRRHTSVLLYIERLLKKCGQRNHVIAHLLRDLSFKVIG